MRISPCFGNHSLLDSKHIAQLNRSGLAVLDRHGYRLSGPVGSCSRAAVAPMEP
jgi:hypothetical protein